MSATTFSPSLTVSSQQDDIDMSFAEKGELPDFQEMFDFDGYGSAGDNSSHSHSPNTASPNATPSPLAAPAHEPYMHDYMGSTAMDFPLFSLPEVKEAPAAAAGAGSSSVSPATASLEEILAVKQEPMEFSFENTLTATNPTTTIPAAPPAPAPAPAADLMALPFDQQLALQKLMENILNYQKQFGTELPGAGGAAAAAGAPAAKAAETIEPSMLMGGQEGGVGVSAPAAVSAAAPVQPAPAASAPAAEPTPTTAATSTSATDDEPLRSITESPGPSRGRAMSTMSMSLDADDLDSKIDRLVPLPQIFSAGKGKGGKKGGGMSSVVRAEDEDLDDDDSWRPSPEEYKKLSSKEKRQLRNKLSARAFRTRRKDYIGTLEGHIKDRDMVIDEMRSELMSSRVENQDLRKELAALKASTMSILHPESATQSVSPAMVNALAMSPMASTATTPAPATTAAAPAAKVNATAGPGPNTIRRTPTPLNTFNTRKDLPGSLRGWNNDNMFGGGSTVCHTMFTPDLVLPSRRGFADLPRANLNPLLNDPSPAPAAPAPAARAHHLAHPGNGQDTAQPFSEWTESTPFSLRSMDSYRMQMWSRLAREAAADKAHLTGDLRPKFFVEGATPAASPNSADAALMAAAASATQQHVTSKLASSFWLAFQGTNGKALDEGKLAAVVTGQARLKVVAASAASSASAPTPFSEKAEEATREREEDLAALMGGLKLAAGGAACAAGRKDLGVGLGVGAGARENPLGMFCGFLKHAGGLPTRA
ncbi:hypothetical protein IAT38_005473 [Cryptococcus sp. DSM 104549]